jgi:hypothetical protein
MFSFRHERSEASYVVFRCPSLSLGCNMAKTYETTKLWAQSIPDVPCLGLGIMCLGVPWKGSPIRKEKGVLIGHSTFSSPENATEAMIALQVIDVQIYC